MDWTKLVNVAGPLALAAFAGTLLGGIALSFFWKSFGPWKLLDEATRECANCRAERLEDARARADFQGKYADLLARYEILKDAVNRGGLGLNLGPLPPLINITNPSTGGQL